jgi:hypothetical protein
MAGMSALWLTRLTTELIPPDSTMRCMRTVLRYASSSGWS